jgi:ABC transport system ATP-binding/permease protein
MEAEKEKLEKTLYDRQPSGFNDLQTLSAQLADLEVKIETSTERWMELSELSELTV